MGWQSGIACPSPGTNQGKTPGDMADYLRLADARLLLWLNSGLAAHPTLYVAALFVTDQLSDTPFALPSLVLCFWPPRVPGSRARQPELAPLAATAQRVSRAR